MKSSRTSFPRRSASASLRAVLVDELEIRRRIARRGQRVRERARRAGAPGFALHAGLHHPELLARDLDGEVDRLARGQALQQIVIGNVEAHRHGGHQPFDLLVLDHDLVIRQQHLAHDSARRVAIRGGAVAARGDGPTRTGAPAARRRFGKTSRRKLAELRLEARLELGEIRAKRALDGARRGCACAPSPRPARAARARRRGARGRRACRRTGDRRAPRPRVRSRRSCGDESCASEKSAPCRW